MPRSCVWCVLAGTLAPLPAAGEVPSPPDVVRNGNADLLIETLKPRVPGAR